MNIGRRACVRALEEMLVLDGLIRVAIYGTIIITMNSGDDLFATSTVLGLRHGVRGTSLMGRYNVLERTTVHELHQTQIGIKSWRNSGILPPLRIRNLVRAYGR